VTSVDGIRRDVRQGLRALRKTPAFTIGAIVTVAMAVGATAAIFSVVHGVLFRRLPYLHVERVFWIWSDQPGRDRTPFNVPDFIDYRDSTRTLAGFAGYFPHSANLSDEAAAERVQGLRATGNLFDVLGAHARIGRLLQPADEHAGAEPVVVLSEPFWIRRFGGDREMIGRRIRLNGEEYTVVGVLPAGFVTPIREVDFVLPFAPDRDARRAARNSVNFIHGAGRLAEQRATSQVAHELNAIAKRLQERFPVENARKRGVRMVAAIDGVVGAFRTALLTVFAAVGAVLLIACANLANLMLARATSRRRDLAVQIALGASRANVVVQVLIESLLVGISGGLLGMLLAHWGVTALVALAPTELPRAGEIRVDAAVLTFSLAASVLTGALFGVIPAFVSAGVDVREALQGASRGTTASGQRIRGALVSCEVALAVGLLIVMTLLAKSFANVLAVAPGFDAAAVLSARLTLPAKRFENRAAIVAFQRALDGRLSSLPTVTHTGAITLLPLSGLMSRVPFTVEGRAVDRERVPIAQFRTVTPGYFEAARIPLKRGRTFSDQDTERTRAVAVVNEELASHWLDGLDPIGARLLVDDNDGPPRPVEIVGVVGNVRQVSLDGDPTWDLYLTYPQIHPDNVDAAAANMFWIIRTTGDPMSLATGVAREVRRVDPEVAASRIRPVEHYLGDAVAPRRFSLSLMSAFALAALLLAITGIYAVVMYSVSQRAREIGIRIALGAGRSTIVRLVVGHGLRFVVIGLLLGTGMAFAATRLLSSLLFGVAATDPVTFVQVAAIVAVISVIACAAPTTRTFHLAQLSQSGSERRIPG
jgi:putative ABC transport system permease protein